VRVSPERRFVSKRLQESNYLQAIEGGIDSSPYPSCTRASSNGSALQGRPAQRIQPQGQDPVSRWWIFDRGPPHPGRGAMRLMASTTGASRPWIMPWHTIIPPRAGHPLGAHAWCDRRRALLAWSINYHPGRALSASELKAIKDGAGIHVKYVPGTSFRSPTSRTTTCSTRAMPEARPLL